MFFGKRKKGTEGTVRRRAIIESTSEQVPASSYRRNQTLSSYRHDTPDESVRHKAHHLAVQRRKIGSMFAISLGVVMFLMLLLWQLIVQVQVATSTKQLQVAFRGDAYEKVVGDYLLLNPAQRFRSALDEKALSSYVGEQLPEVQTVSLHDGFTGLAKGTFAITFRTPVAGWQINGKQFYVDGSGVVFQKNYYEEPSVQIVDESGVTPEQGTAIASTRLLGFLGKAVAAAEGRGYTVTKAVLLQGTTRTVDLYFSNTSTKARLVIDRGAGEQVEDFDRAHTYLESRGIHAVEYIDVRISGKAAYK